MIEGTFRFVGSIVDLV